MNLEPKTPKKKDRAWKETRVPSYDPTPYSPQISDSFSGIVVWVPPVIQWEQRLRIPVFGVVQMKESELEELGIHDRHPLRATVLGTVAGGTYWPEVGQVLTDGVLFPGPKGNYVREYFNVDLIEVTGAAFGIGTLFVFASVGPYTAPVIEVEVTR